MPGVLSRTSIATVRSAPDLTTALAGTGLRRNDDVGSCAARAPPPLDTRPIRARASATRASARSRSETPHATPPTRAPARGRWTTSRAPPPGEILGADGPAARSSEIASDRETEATRPGPCSAPPERLEQVRDLVGRDAVRRRPRSSARPRLPRPRCERSPCSSRGGARSRRGWRRSARGRRRGSRPSRAASGSSSSSARPSSRAWALRRPMTRSASRPTSADSAAPSTGGAALRRPSSRRSSIRTAMLWASSSIVRSRSLRVLEALPCAASTRTRGSARAASGGRGRPATCIVPRDRSSV